ncbi:Metalloenzyme, LuxS/M16 peptidase-like protein [Zopfochytrium polystomum]|nr:Metalloenzyme, LuxS/M16 peptidase-like protein [Zopfochytrium polystomum]
MHRSNGLPLFNRLAAANGGTAGRYTPRQRLFSSVAELDSFRVGSHVAGFDVLRVKRVDDFDLTAVQLKHGRTGADYLHIFKDDANNVFNVGFKTAPYDSTGVAHILEHTALCGSKQFPVRDPFFKMLNRSMATFMNAMTGSDYTMYPFSTENEADFDNLFSVYMDATLFPLLRNLDFKQEGWRLEHQDPLDPSSPIIFKGVVFNEMKGVFSDVNNIFLQRLQQSIYPGTTYGFVSGGDPENITDLSLEGLRQFHRENYHPSNAMFVTYGSFPLLKRLEAVNEKISQFSPIERKPIEDVKRFDQPKTIRMQCPPDPMGDPERQTRMSLSYLTNDGTDAFETFAMRLIAYLLTDGAASPFYRALIETNIGTDYAPSTGYDNTVRQTSFSVGLQGIRSSQVEMVEQKINEVFAQVAKEGFPAHRIESAIHQMELGIRHRRADFGMGLSQSVIQQWIHGGDPINALEVTKYIAQLREELRNPDFFSSRINKYFLNNTHKILFIMEPSETYTAELDAREKERLQKMVSGLTEGDKTRIYEEGIELKSMQEEKPDLSCLPTLNLSDVPLKGKAYSVVDRPLQHLGVPVQWRETATNGVSYVEIAKSIEGIPDDLVPFVPLYCSALAAFGTKEIPSVPDLIEEIRRYTSGIGATPMIVTAPSSLDATTSAIHFSTSALDGNVPRAYSLLADVIDGPDLSDASKLQPGSEVFERMRTVVAGIATGGMSSLADSGHRYAVGVAGKGLGPASAVRERLGGLESVVFMNKLMAAGDEGIKLALEKIQQISQFLRTGQSPIKAAVISGSSPIRSNEEGLEGLLKRLEWTSKKSVVNSTNFAPTFTNSHVPLPFTVNYTARVFKSVPYSHEDSTSLMVLADLMTSRFLHKEIREKGGAYGAFAFSNAADGLFAMASYRDPPGAGTRTMDAYNRAVEWAADISKHVEQSELNEAKLSLLGKMDMPLSAADEGMGRFRSGIDDEMRQTRRQRLLGVTLESVQRVAQSYLAGKPSSRAILGPSEEELHSGQQWVVESVN